MSEESQQPLRVLMVGTANAVIIDKLVGCMKAAEPSLFVRVSGYTQFGADDGNPEGHVIDERVEVIKFRKEKEGTPKQQKKSTAGRVAKTRPAGRSVARSLKIWAKILYGRLISGVLRRRYRELWDDVDVIHVQGAFWSPVCDLFAWQDVGKPVVVSLWGSDVLRQSEPAITFAQQTLLRRAAAVTGTGPEFKEIVLSKYGRDLAPKHFDTYFSPDLMAIVRADRSESAARARAKHSVPEGRKLVCIGHNGHREGQQGDLIVSLAQLSEERKAEVFVVVPMTYGGDASHPQEVRDGLASIGVDGCVLEDLLSDEEVDDLRLATDCLIYAPVSDAFSATVSQALAAGSVVILGAWLPYKARITAGFCYSEIDSTSGAGEALVNVLDDWPLAVERALPNRQLSGEFFSPERIGRGWVEVYRDAIAGATVSE